MNVKYLIKNALWRQLYETTLLPGKYLYYYEFEKIDRICFRNIKSIDIIDNNIKFHLKFNYYDKKFTTLTIKKHENQDYHETLVNQAKFNLKMF